LWPYHAFLEIATLTYENSQSGHYYCVSIIIDDRPVIMGGMTIILK